MFLFYSSRWTNTELEKPQTTRVQRNIPYYDLWPIITPRSRRSNASDPRTTSGMVSPWWSLAGVVFPIALLRTFITNHEPVASAATDPGRHRDLEQFVCSRVCTSKKMLAKVGALSKDPTPNTCVTVCGESEFACCTEACRMTVCVIPHHVPNWNDVCMRRCSNECLKTSEK